MSWYSFVTLKRFEICDVAPEARAEASVEFRTVRMAVQRA